jgi:hypothetical protein
MGGTIAFEVGIQKGTGGYSDKNVVRQYLSPNPKSDSFKKWQQLAGGAASPTQGALAGGSFFKGPQQASAPAALSQPSWLGGANAAAPKLDDDIPF